MSATLKEVMNVFSVFVTNIPPKVNWKWLQNIFQHHGKVIDVFIPKKRSSRGQKFGFVHFSNLWEAKTAARRLNGAWLFDYCLKVNISSFNSRSYFCRRLKPSVSAVKGPIPCVEVQNRNVTQAVFPPKGSFVPSYRNALLQGLDDFDEGGRVQQTQLAPLVNKRKTCHSVCDNDVLLRLQNCFIGYIKGNLDIVSLLDNFKSEGFEGISVRKLSGAHVLIDPEELVISSLMENWKSSWLCSWFNDIHPWSLKGISFSRITWLKCLGVPFHLWNYGTFRNLASLWGDFIYIDRNTLAMEDFSFGAFQIKTSSLEKIDEIVDLVCDTGESLPSPVPNRIEDELSVSVARGDTTPGSINDKPCALVDGLDTDCTLIGATNLGSYSSLPNVCVSSADPNLKINSKCVPSFPVGSEAHLLPNSCFGPLPINIDPSSSLVVSPDLVSSTSPQSFSVSISEPNPSFVPDSVSPFENSCLPSNSCPTSPFFEIHSCSSRPESLSWNRDKEFVQDAFVVNRLGVVRSPEKDLERFCGLSLNLFSIKDAVGQDKGVDSADEILSDSVAVESPKSGLILRNKRGAKSLADVEDSIIDNLRKNGRKKGRKPKNRLRKVQQDVSSSKVANASLSDSDFIFRNEAYCGDDVASVSRIRKQDLFKKATETWELGKLLGFSATCEDDIIIAELVKLQNKGAAVWSTWLNRFERGLIVRCKAYGRSAVGSGFCGLANCQHLEIHCGWFVQRMFEERRVCSIMQLHINFIVDGAESGFPSPARCGGVLGDSSGSFLQCSRGLLAYKNQR
ncbi:hypothetical protein REPUB_Repub16aG0113800 [Reevesia pubescens]